MKYTIQWEPMPVVIVLLEQGESMITESGAMAWMSEKIKMETKGGSVGKVFGRMFSGEHAFQNVYTAEANDSKIAFASKFVGQIKAIEINPDHPIICQKSAFLASTSGVELSVFWQKNVGAGLFGGEGFIMQKLSGSGTAFVEIDGSAVEYELAVGEKMILDTGYLALCDSTVKIEAKLVSGVKNAILGGEGLFNTVVTGPGKIIVQTMPINKFAGLINSKVLKVK